MERRPPNLPNPTILRQNSPMRHLTTFICLTLAVLLGGAGESFALPKCPSYVSPSNWTNCFATWFAPNGDKYVGEWKDGKKHGQGTDSYTTGEKYVGGYKDGKKHGQGTDTSYGRKYVGEYKDGIKEGSWVVYDHNGQLSSKNTYKDGKEEGLYEGYHDNGQLFLKGKFKDGKEVGLWKGYHPNGEIYLKENFKDGKLHGSWERYGEEDYCMIGQLTEKRIFQNYEWDKGRNYSFLGEFLLFGHAHKYYGGNGPYELYHCNGQLWSKGTYWDGFKEGHWVTYYDNGQLESKGDYKNVRLEGPWVVYHDNGQLMSKGTYKNGEEEGAWVFFNEDGSKRMSPDILERMLPFLFGSKPTSGIYKSGKKVSD